MLEISHSDSRQIQVRQSSNNYQTQELKSQREEYSLKRLENAMEEIEYQYSNRNKISILLILNSFVEDYINLETRSLSNLSIKRFQKAKIMKELLKAFPTIHQERRLTSLEKGRMIVQILGQVILLFTSLSITKI